ncbi:MAG TPA: aromatic amino acid hydroxylase [Thermoanaerobaculaceae bacterium]|nr:aromatic amino acid hydroxylase [Thermoanaerobaculaceae bacterium]
MATTPTESIYGIQQIARLPHHLKQHIVEQQYDRYSPVDHSVWRYIMRQAVDFHAKHAHEAYVEGLRRTGIGLERIPRVEEMNEILGRIGWGAAPVDGFIPPAAFMEFQAHRVLVIAADMRQINHIQYTPAPDIVHEAAGHAPIIADPEYAEYLRRFGEVGAKALSSRQDFELYEAIRHLSILKEAPGTPAAEVEAAEKLVAERQAGLGEPSEMARLSRLHWWTVEYGLIGDLAHPRLYGAGLLSSIGEAEHCLTDAVKKLPYTAGAADVAFDITTFQPQLFVAESFAQLNDVLDQFADTMAFRRGGRYGLEAAIASANVATVEYSSGLQVSGTVAEVLANGSGEPVYFRTKGPTALAVGGVQLEGHGKETHADGFGAPVGRVAGHSRPLEFLDDEHLRAIGLERGREASLELPGGVRVQGRLEQIVRAAGRTVLLSFSGCTVARGDRLLFDPSWGTYDMPVGERVVSVFHGAADQDAYEQVSFVPKERTVKVHADEATRRIHRLYDAVRQVRESGHGVEALSAIYLDLRANHPGDWLLALEILELLAKHGADPALQSQIRGYLESRADEPELSKLVRNGLRLLEN